MFRTNIRYNELKNTLNENYIGAELKYFSSAHGMYEVREIINTTKPILLRKMIIDIVANGIIKKTVLSIHTKKTSGDG